MVVVTGRPASGLRGGGSSGLGQGGEGRRRRVPSRSWRWNQLIGRWLWMEGMSEREGFRMTPGFRQQQLGSQDVFGEDGVGVEEGG